MKWVNIPNKDKKEIDIEKKKQFRIVDDDENFRWVVEEKMFSKGLGVYWNERGSFITKHYAKLFKQALELENRNC